ncbi:SRPBCC domain-containing protein [Paenibacillus sp. GYB003]
MLHPQKETWSITNASGKKRTDSASRVIKASPQNIYNAFVDPESLISSDHATKGKTSEHTDIVNGKFLELVPDERIVQSVEFQSDDPAFAGEMIMTWTFAAVPEGTAVTIVCENVPEGIRKEDHDVGLRSSLENLAEYIE